MRIMEVLLLSTVLIPFAIPLAGSKSHGEPNAHACMIPGWIANVDPQGVAVRVAPASDAAVLARLPSTVESDYLPIAVDITASSDGWLHIENPAYDPDPRDPSDPEMPLVSGWVDQSATVVIVQGKRGRSAPSTRARILDEFKEGWLSDSAGIDRVLDCKGRWVKVEYRHLVRDDSTVPYSMVAGGPVREAWFTDLCGIQETTCDMPTTD